MIWWRHKCNVGTKGHSGAEIQQLLWLAALKQAKQAVSASSALGGPVNVKMNDCGKHEVLTVFLIYMRTALTCWQVWFKQQHRAVCDSEGELSAFEPGCSVCVVDTLSWPHSPWCESVISLGVGPYTIYTALRLWFTVCNSHRDLHLMI